MKSIYCINTSYTATAKTAVVGITAQDIKRWVSCWTNGKAHVKRSLR